MNESPYSWNTTYRTPSGFVCQLTIRSEKSGAELFEKAEAALAWLKDHECQPSDRYGNATQPPASNGTAAAPQQTVAPPAGTPGWCHVHNVQMKWRAAKDGSSDGWFSHKAPDGSWCRGG